MTAPRKPPKVWLLPALTEPIVTVIQRNSRKEHHILKWNTERGSLEHGSWFRGAFYPEDCDVSEDGRWLAVLAGGHQAEKFGWSFADKDDFMWVAGVAESPWLSTVIEWSGFSLGLSTPWVALCGDRVLLNDNKSGYYENRYRNDCAHRFADIVSVDDHSENQILEEEKYPLWYLKLPLLQSWLHINPCVDAFPVTVLRGAPGMPDVRITTDRKTWHHSYEVTGWESSEEHLCAVYDCLGQLLVARNGGIELWNAESMRKMKPVYRVDLMPFETGTRGMHAIAELEE